MTEGTNTEGTQGEGTNTEPKAKDTTNHNGITQAMYDETKRSERLHYANAADKQKFIDEHGGRDEISAKLAELEKLKNGSVKNEEDYEARIKESNEAVRQPLLEKIKELEEKLDGANATVHEVTVTTAAMNEVRESGLIAEDMLPIFKDLYLSKNIQSDENGVYVTDDNGEPIYDGSSRKTISDLVSEIVKDHPSFAADKSSNNTRPGGGSSSSQPDTGNFDQKVYSSLSSKQERVDYLRKTGYANAG